MVLYYDGKMPWVQAGRPRLEGVLPCPFRQRSVLAALCGAKPDANHFSHFFCRSADRPAQPDTSLPRGPILPGADVYLDNGGTEWITGTYGPAVESRQAASQPDSPRDRQLPASPRDGRPLQGLPRDSRGSRRDSRGSPARPGSRKGKRPREAEAAGSARS